MTNKSRAEKSADAWRRAARFMYEKMPSGTLNKVDHAEMIRLVGEAEYISEQTDEYKRDIESV